MSPTITPILKSIIPNFILEDHPNFVAFIEAYYEWLEGEGGAVYQTNQYEKNVDIDTTVDDFIKHFKNTFLKHFPENISADKKQLIKYVSEYYRARGTEKSYKLFFRILFNEDSDLYYPRVDLFRPSDGKWIQDRTLRVFPVIGNPFNFSGKKIIDKSTNATAFVESVHKVQEGVFEVYELFLNTNSITGTFNYNNKIEILEDPSIIAQIYPVPTSIEILNSGEDYYPENTEFNILGGVGGKAYVKSSTDLFGIKTIKIRNFGAGYYNTPNIDLSLGGTVPEESQAELKINLGALCVYEGRFKNSDSFVSDIKFLQDGKFYQQFSYQTILEESLAEYKDILLNELHPAGFTLFGLVRIQRVLDSKGDISSLQPGSVFSTCKELDINNSLTEDLTLEVINVVELKHDSMTQKIGPTLNSLERDKFYYKPYEGYDANSEVSGTVNDGYWDSNPITPIEHFSNLTTQQFVENKFKKTNITPDSVIICTV
jgi:hypothetical protein